MQVTTIGLDLAKHVFHVHGIDAAEKVAVRKQFRRGQVMKFFEALIVRRRCPTPVAPQRYVTTKSRLSGRRRGGP
jgi:transposase